jgi:UPF0716 family protein affecting phage T7 exclusion
MAKFIKFFDKLEDKIRKRLSRKPLIYALVGSIGIILLWRGVWMLADALQMPGWVSAALGLLILLSIGLFVSFFVGEQIIISGIKKEKRIDEKTEEEIKKEETTLSELHEDIEKIKKELEKIRGNKKD